MSDVFQTRRLIQKANRQEAEYEAKIPLDEKEAAKIKFGDWLVIKEEGEPDAVALAIPHGPVSPKHLLDVLVFWDGGNKMMRDSIQAEQVLAVIGSAKEPLNGKIEVPGLPQK
jgi:hypothetical protein